MRDAPDATALARFSAQPFRPHPLLANAHAQTCFATCFPRDFAGAKAWRAAGVERHFTLSDGDRLRAVVHLQAGAEHRPLLVLLHGLEGSSEAHYLQGLSAKAFALGYHSLRLNFRSCGGSEELARRLYHGGMISDVAEVLETLRAEGFSAIHLMGVSLGANLLLRLLAELGAAARPWLAGAVAISAPIDMAMTGEALGRGLNMGYNQYFLLQLRARLARSARTHADCPELAAWAAEAQRVSTLGAFDDRITAVAGGYADGADYYRRASSGDRLGAIRVPTLLVHAQDDPFVPYAMYRDREALIRENPFLHPLFPARGGHVGFMEAGLHPRPEPWMDGFWAENQALAFARWVDSQRTS